MKLNKNIIIITVLGSTVFLLTVALFLLIIFKSNLLSPEASMKEKKSTANYNFISNDNKTYQKEYSFNHVIAWLPDFDYANGKVSFYENIDRFTEISPVYYQLNEDGTLSAKSIAGDTNLLFMAKKAGVRVTPSIASFDDVGVENMLSTDQKIKDHNEFILSEIDKYGYDGIDIDYESIGLSDKDAFFKMLEDLSNAMHRKNKTLSVSVLSKWKEEGYNGFKETREVQDWNRLAKYADQIRIMVYDYSGSAPGPISPINWLEDVLKYGISKTTKEKLIIGQPLYAYSYGAARTAYTFDGVQKIMNDTKAIPVFDKDSNEKILTYKVGDEERKMWFEDYETMLKRMSLIAQYGVGGVSFWRLGGEDELIYSAINKK